MRLLFDEHLSPRLVRRLADLFQDSTHVQLVGLRGARDRALWLYAREQDLVLVSRDADFERLSMELGPPPKVIILRLADGDPAVVEALLRTHAPVIARFADDLELSLLVISP